MTANSVELGYKDCRILSNIYIFDVFTPHAHLHYVYNMYAWYAKYLLKTVGRVDNPKPIPYNVKSGQN